MNRFLILLGVGAMALTMGEYAGAADRNKRPNVLFIAMDDMNDWVGCLGGHPQAKTPHIDALAKQGILFTNAHCAAPLCNPSRAAVFSGRQPFNTGIYNNGSSLKDVRSEVTLMPQAFKAAGYQTYGTGKLLHKGSKGLWDREFFPEQRWSPFSKDQVKYTEEELPSKGTSSPRHVIKSGPNGRETILPLNRMPSDRRPNKVDGESFDWGPFDIADSQMGDGQITDWANDCLREHRERSDDSPFFLAVGYYRPHIPLFAPSRYFMDYPEEKTILPPILENDRADLPETAKRWVSEAGTAGSHATVLKYGQHKAGVAAYLACVTFVDAQIGRLLETLHTTGQAANTIIVLWSDHGWHLGEKQHWGKWTGWERSTRVPLIFAMDPTKQTNLVVPNRRCSAPVSLIDMYPTLVEMCALPAVASLDGRSLVSLLKDPAQSTDRVVVTTFGEGNYSLRSARYRYIRYADGSEELYDHKNDPNEWINLANNPELAHIKRGMKQQLPKRMGG
ncbi:sulfatase [Planctomycetota bacterium]